MSPATRLKSMTERKQRLIEESELRRVTLIAACAPIDRQLDWLDRSVMFVQRALPVCTTALTIWDWWRSRRND